MGRDLLCGQIDQRRLQLLQFEGELGSPAQADGDHRRLAAVFIPDSCLVFPLAALWRCGALGSKLVQHLAAQAVEGGQRHRKPLLHQGPGPGAAVGGAACLAQLGLHRQTVDGPGTGRLRDRPLGGGHMAVPVLHSHLHGLPRPDHGVEGHRHAGPLPLFIGGTGLGEQLAGLRRILPDAEHLWPLPPHVVAVGEALTGKGLLQRPQFLSGGIPALPERVGVHLGDHPDILRPLHPALNLGAGYPHLIEFVEVGSQGHVLEGQGVAVRPIPPAIGESAGLGAQAPVAAAPPYDRGQEALTRVAHAQRPVDKYLDLNGGVCADVGDVLPGQFPAEHHTAHAQVGGSLHAVQAVNGHLGGGVDRQVRCALAQGAHQSHILHQHCVRPQLGGR